MSRISPLESPFLLGFERLGHLVDQVSRSGAEGYPPYNIEKIAPNELQITLAVAGFSKEALSVVTENRQLLITGNQPENGSQEFLHRGIATRKFRRTFILADGVEVVSAALKDGLLSIKVVQPEPQERMREIEISSPEETPDEQMLNQ